MADIPDRKTTYASNVEASLRQSSGIDLTGRGFDYGAFLDDYQKSIDPAPATPNVAIDLPYKEAEELASLSGKFSPADLLPRKLPLALANLVLSSLAVHCSIDKVKKVRWILNHQRRKEVLDRLLRENRLRDRLAGKLPATDLFGILLRKVLQQPSPVAPDQLSQPELKMLVNVLEAIQDLNLSLPRLEEIRDRVLSPGMLAGYTYISADFVGRDTELSQLRAFLLRQPGNTLQYWSGLVITGMGGVGKSTLLAKFAGDLMSDKTATISILDFDRPGINATDSLWLVQEVSRQVQEQFPKARARLTQARKMARERKKYGEGGSSVSDTDTGWYGALPLVEDIKNTLLSPPATPNQPFLLILDTVEEVLQNMEFGWLNDWVTKFAEQLYPIPVKVILSGRLYDNQLLTVTQHSGVDDIPMRIEEFDPAIAAIFLQKRGLSTKMTNKIISSNAIPLRPLELKLLSKLLQERSISFDAINRELSSGVKKKGADQLFTGIIYRRVLMRIRDKRVRAIAYPGLILRYVTPELVMNVLRPALRLKNLEEKEAAEVVRKLAGLNWLAYEENGRVWHRKDLRRGMLQLMISKDPAIATRIREAAIAWFGSGKTPEARAECTYHRLMMVQEPEDGQHFPVADLKSAWPFINRDIGDMSRTAAVLLQYGVGLTMRDADVQELPKVYFKEAYQPTGKSLVSARKYTEAHRLYKRGLRLGIAPAPGVRDELLDKWASETLFCTMDWDQLVNIEPFFRAPVGYSLVSVLNYLYPVALVAPALIDAPLLEVLLHNASGSKNLFGAVTQEGNRLVMLYRLSVCLTILSGMGKLTKKAIRSLRSITSDIQGKAYSKSVSLLELIASGSPQTWFYPGIDSLRLDKDWLLATGGLLRPDFQIDVDGFFRIIHDSAGNAYTVRQFLARIDGDADLRQKWRSARIRITGMNRHRLYELLKGPDTIFRDPCRYAVMDAFRSRADIAQLVEIFMKLTPVYIGDLHSEHLHQLISDNRELALEPFIELIDRSWAMGRLLNLCGKAKPENQKLLYLKTAHRRWEKMLERLVTGRH